MLTCHPQSIYIVGLNPLFIVRPELQSLPYVFAEQLNFVHDRNGNLVSGDGFFREYNEFNQLVRIRNGTNSSGAVLEEYVYHPTEERVWVKKVYNASSEVAETTIYISDTFVRIVNSSGTYDFAYIKHEGQLVAQVAAGGNTEFIHGIISVRHLWLLILLVTLLRTRRMSRSVGLFLDNPLIFS